MGVMSYGCIYCYVSKMGSGSGRGVNEKYVFQEIRGRFECALNSYK